MSTIRSIPKTRFLPPLATRHLIGGEVRCLVVTDMFTVPPRPMLGLTAQEDHIVARARVIWTPAGLTVRLGIEEAIEGGFEQPNPLVTYQLIWNGVSSL